MSKNETDGVWVGNDKLDAFMKLSGELVVLKNYFHLLARDPEVRVDPKKLDRKILEVSRTLNKITDSLQEQIMSVRKITLDLALSSLPGFVGELSRELGKPVHFVTKGLELGVDKNIANALTDILPKLIRQRLEHGIESPEKRQSAGKSTEGTVSLTVSEVAGVIHVAVSDDGAGAGSDISSDDANKSILAVHGKIRVNADPGKGATVVLEIPAPKTVMVEKTIVTRTKNTVIAVPLTTISRITRCDELTISEVRGHRMCQYSGKTVPIRTYQELINRVPVESASELKSKQVVFIHNNADIVGLIVDTIEDQLEAVVRPFDNIVKAMPGFKGTTVLDTGNIAFIVSPEEMIHLAA